MQSALLNERSVGNYNAKVYDYCLKHRKEL